MSRQRMVVSVLAGVVTFGLAELVQTRQILQRLEAEGVTVHLPPFNEPVHLSAPSGGGPSALELPADVTTMQKRMHWVAAGAAAAALVGVFAFASK